MISHGCVDASEYKGAVHILRQQWVQLVPETPKTAYVIYEQSRTSSAGEYEKNELSNVCGI